MRHVPSISTHSNVSRPSGPENDQVISQIRGALTTFLIRRFPGQRTRGSATMRSAAT